MSQEHPSLEEKRALLKQLLQQGRTPATFPLSSAQRRLWFLNQMNPTSSAYNLSRIVRFSGDMNISALERSLRTIIERHSILRTSFTTADGHPMQVVASARSADDAWALLLIDCSALAGPERDAQLQARLTAEGQRPFDLQRGPLLRAQLFRLPPQDGRDQHVLLLTLHHIVADGWSITILLRELTTLYRAFVTGESLVTALPELPIQYSDYARWEQDWLKDDVLHTQLAYWTRQLGGTLPVLELPIDHMRPAVQTFRGAKHTQRVPAALVEALQTLSRREGVTLFMTLLTAFKTLLWRYSGQQDLLVGIPIANRTRLETEPLIGCFANTLVLRIALAGDQEVRALLQQVRRVCLEAYAHPDLSFEHIVDALNPQRDLSHPPIFQVMFAMQAAPPPTELPGLTTSPIELVDQGAAAYDLRLSMEESHAGLTAIWEYNTDLFVPATVARLAQHFETLLSSIVAAPAQRLAELSLLSDAERRQLMLDWNATYVALDDRCVHALFEAQAARTPDAVAVLFADSLGTHQLSYAELNARANQLGYLLQQRGVGPDVGVALCVERGPEQVIGFLGILKAGGAYVPLDPDYPTERLSFMLSDLETPVVLTQAHLEARLADIPSAPSVLCLDRDWPTIAQHSTANPRSAASPDNLAYLIYTSGSTGRPKGVLLPHRGLSSLMQTTVEQMNITVGSRVLQFASLSFDASVWEMCVALLGGGTLCIGRRTDLLPGAALQHFLRAQRVTLALLSPTALTLLPPDDLPDLRTVIAGTERCSGEVVAQWTPGRRFFNAYGPTETTVYSTLMECSGSYPQGPPIGRPVANTQVYLLDADMRPVPIGVVGELYIGGIGLAWGYRHRPALTAERFVPDPFGQLSGHLGGGRLYRSGDLARYHPDGTIDYLGRADEQVKIRGFRIEPGEISATLAQHPAVQESVVIVREDAAPGSGPAEKRLVAYVIPTADQSPSTSELRSFLAARLPEYMLPSAFVLLDALPLTPNGKLDRRALPAPDGVRPQLDAAYVLPTTEAEQTIATVWQQLLGVDRVGRHDSFFDLGGNSLLLIQSQQQLSLAFGHQITILDLFKYPTVQTLAAHLSQSSTAAPAADVSRETQAEKGKAWLKQRGARKQRES